MEKTSFDLSGPSKMPCHSFSIPISHCKTGSKLREIPGSVCFKCYAGRNFYNMPVVKNALARRYDGLRDPGWVEGMVTSIRSKDRSGYFRWHDSGDLQGIWHLKNICAVARALPEIKFWLPTKEGKLVDRYRKLHGEEPANLTIRISAHMIDERVDRPISSMVCSGEPPRRLGKQGAEVDVWSCPAPRQGNKCLECRACWMKEVPVVAYHEH